MKSNSNSAPPTPVDDVGGEQDPWETLAAAAGETPAASTPSTEPISVSHAEGETFTMPEANAPTQKNEFLTAMSNLGNVITAKAQEVDQQHHVSEKWGNVKSATKQKTDEINDKYHVSEKWSNFTTSVTAKVDQVKEDPKTKEATDKVKRSLDGAKTWVSRRLQDINKPK